MGGSRYTAPLLAGHQREPFPGRRRFYLGPLGLAPPCLLPLHRPCVVQRTHPASRHHGGLTFLLGGQRNRKGFPSRRKSDSARLPVEPLVRTEAPRRGAATQSKAKQASRPCCRGKQRKGGRFFMFTQNSRCWLPNLGSHWALPLQFVPTNDAYLKGTGCCLQYTLCMRKITG